MKQNILISLSLMSLMMTSPLVLAQTPLSDADIVTKSDMLYCPHIESVKNDNPIDLTKQPDDGSVYRVGNNRWDQKWEDEYAKWMGSPKVDDVEFMNKFGIESDCTDAAMIKRAIFARMHNLPVLFLDNDGKQMSQSQKEWSKVPTVTDWNEGNWETSLKNDLRFREAIKAWGVNIGTINLDKSTYQIQVFDNLEHPSKLSGAVQPGCVLSSDTHTSYVSNIKTEDYFPVKQLSSSRGVKVRKLFNGTAYIDQAPGSSTYPERGLVKWNWPVNCNGVWALVSDKSQPEYSDQQKKITQNYCEKIAKDVHMDYVPGDKTIYRNLIEFFARKPGARFTESEKQEMWSSIDLTFKERAKAVQDAQQFTESDYKADKKKYADMSTPAMDQSFKLKLQTLYDLVAKFEGPPGIERFEMDMLHSQVEISPGKKISMYHVFQMFKQQKDPQHPMMSYEPWDSPEKRWGIGDKTEVDLLIQTKKQEMDNQIKIATALQPPGIFDENHHLKPQYLDEHQHIKVEYLKDPKFQKWMSESSKIGVFDEYIKVASTWQR